MRYSAIENRVVDAKGNTISFALGLDNQFYMVFEADGASNSWKKVNLTGDGWVAHSFAVSQNQSGELFLALARGKSMDSTSELLLTSAISNDMEATNWDDTDSLWSPAVVTESKHIKCIYLGTDDDGQGAPMVLIRTTEMKNKIPVHYSVDPTGVDALTLFPKLDDADQVYDMTIGNLPQARVAYILYRKGRDVLVDVRGLPDPLTNVSFLTQLDPPEGAMALKVEYDDSGYSDLHIQANGDYIFKYNQQTGGAKPTLVRKDGPSIRPRITTRSVLSEDYELLDGKLARFQTYRTTFTVPPEVKHADIWASEATKVEIDGAWYDVDPVRPVRVRPNRMNLIVVNMKAEKLGCPSLRLHTDTMQPFSRYFACPDVDVNRKIGSLEKGALHRNRKRLGISEQFSEDDCNHIQKTMQSMVKTAQYTYNRTPHGFHHDKGLLPSNMDDPHFSLDFTAGKPVVYQSLTRDEVASSVKGATRIDHDTEQGFLDDIGDFVEKASSVVVHTVENVGHDIVDTGKRIVGDTISAVEAIGEDIIQGNVLDIPGEIIQGGENLGTDLFKGATNVVGDVVKGAGQLVVVTLKFAEKAYQFVITHTGVVGEFIGKLFEKIGSALGKALDWLLSQFGWDDILHTHDYIADQIRNGVGNTKELVTDLKAKGDAFFTGLEDIIISDIDKAVTALETSTGAKQPSPATGHSEAMDKLQWVMARLSSNAGSGSALTGLGSMSGGVLSDMATLLETRMGKDGGKVWSAFESAFSELQLVFSDPSAAPSHLLSAFLELAKGVAVAGLEIVNGIFDGVLDLVNSLLDGLLKVLQEAWQVPFLSDLYEMITEGRKLSLLSLTSLVLAIPATLLHKGLFGTAPFASYKSSATSLPEQSEPIRGAGAVYSACHLALTVLSPVVNAKTAYDALSDGMDETFDISDPNASLSKFDIATDVINSTIGFVAQLTANPIPPTEPYVMPLDRAKDDLYEAPGYWGHVIWWYQWGGWGVNTIYAIGKNVAAGGGATKYAIGRSGDVVAALNCVYGVCHLGLMATLDQADRHKTDALEAHGTAVWNDMTDHELALTLQAYTEQKTNHPAYFNVELETSEKISEWVGNIRGYKAFANKGGVDGGIPRKGFGNVMDSFPEIGQLGAMPEMIESTEMISLAVTAGVDVFGHLSEGITYAVRTGRNELY